MQGLSPPLSASWAGLAGPLVRDCTRFVSYILRIPKIPKLMNFGIFGILGMCRVCVSHARSDYTNSENSKIMSSSEFSELGSCGPPPNNSKYVFQIPDVRGPLPLPKTPSQRSGLRTPARPAVPKRVLIDWMVLVASGIEVPQPRWSHLLSAILSAVMSLFCCWPAVGGCQARGPRLSYLTRVGESPKLSGDAFSTARFSDHGPGDVVSESLLSGLAFGLTWVVGLELSRLSRV